MSKYIKNCCVEMRTYCSERLSAISAISAVALRFLNQYSCIFYVKPKYTAYRIQILNVDNLGGWVRVLQLSAPVELHSYWVGPYLI